MKVGDLVKRESTPRQLSEAATEYGVVIKMSRTGHDTESAQVLFTDGELWWLDTQHLEIIDESR